MCLAVPGKIVSVAEAAPRMRVGQVDFGGVTREVNLACVPEAAVGDYVLVHVGFALSVIDAAEAERVFSYLRELEAP
jgi:hydrogenase expression/formation protein HypC